jgi:hypothetical protein
MTAPTATSSRALTSKEWRELGEALVHAFPSVEQLQQFVRFGIDQNLAEIAGGADLGAIVFNLIQNTEARGWTDDLIKTALELRPGNPKLRAFKRAGPKDSFTPAVDFAKDQRELLKSMDVWAPVRAMYRRVHEFQGQLCDSLAELSDALGEMNLQFECWKPSPCGVPPKGNVAFFRDSDGASAFLPFHRLSIFWRTPESNTMTRKRVQVELVADTGAPVNLTGDTGLDMFAPLEEAKSVVEVRMFRLLDRQSDLTMEWERSERLRKGLLEHDVLPLMTPSGGSSFYSFFIVDANDLLVPQRLAQEVIKPIDDWFKR